MIENYLKYFQNDLFFLADILNFTNKDFILDVDNDLFRNKEYLNKFLCDYYKDMKVSLNDRLFLI